MFTRKGIQPCAANHALRNLLADILAVRFRFRSTAAKILTFERAQKSMPHENVIH
jgi:hypothetical protein